MPFSVDSEVRLLTVSARFLKEKAGGGTTNLFKLSYVTLLQAELHCSVIKCLAAFASSCFDSIGILKER